VIVHGSGYAISPHATSLPTVVLVGLHDEAVVAVHEILRHRAHVVAQLDFADAAHHVKQASPDVLITCDGAPANELARELPKGQSTQITLADNFDAPRILAAMRAGFEEYLVLPQDNARLQEIIRLAIPEPCDGDNGSGGGEGAAAHPTGDPWCAPEKPSS